MRDELSRLLTFSGVESEKFFILSGDHGYALFDSFRKECPTQFINAGICEQAMVGYAAGFAKKGLIPIVYGLAAFIPMRVLEFIKMQVCYENLKVIFIGDGAGLVYSTLGSSHQCGEDVGALNLLPNVKIFTPADKFEIKECYERAMNYSGPSYLRMGKSDRPSIHSNNSKILENAYLLNDSSIESIAFVSMGSMVSPVFSIVGDKAPVFSIPFFTDFSFENFQALFGKVQKIIVVEEHVIEGGLFSKMAQLNSLTNLKIELVHIGLKKDFTTKGCDYQTALAEHNLSDIQLKSVLKSHL
jgi:transketolase